MSAVRFEGVSKLFGPVIAVNELSLDIADGEFLVLVGPSGCGKTTACGCSPGSSARRRARSASTARRQHSCPKDRDIAMVFQSYALYPHMTVLKNLAFGLQGPHDPEGGIDRTASRRSRRCSASSKLLERGRASCRAASASGSRWGGRWCADPQVFLMDEPLSNLDAALRVADARRDPAAARAARDHDRVRHARSGRGDDDGRLGSRS